MTSAKPNSPSAYGTTLPGSHGSIEVSRLALGIDVGGTGIKGGVVDTHTGELVGDRYRIPTPRPATPEAVAGVISDVVDHLREREGLTDDPNFPAGVTFPGIVIDNVVLSAANIDDTWIECDAFALLDFLPVRVSTLNDADAAGLAEARFGAGRGGHGTTLTVTLGTGVGTALVHDGVLVPNSELGHVIFDGDTAEKSVSAAARERADMPWADYGELLGRYLQHLERIQPVKRFIIGGGVSKRSEDFLPYVQDLRAEVMKAELVNNAGIVGAALFAAEQAALADEQTEATV